jgi:predicted RNA-binding Zn-ribbon protein involved in translation (DUF1610 family)
LKSFRLYLPHRVVTPLRFVGDYQPEELERFRDEFQPIARRYRRFNRFCYVSLAILAACVPLFLTFPLLDPWLWGAMIFFWSMLMLLAIQPPAPDCPACRNALDQGVGYYCPECGAKAIQRGDALSATFCASCGKTIGRSRKGGRRYTIRACSHCGVFLDDEGI